MTFHFKCFKATWLDSVNTSVCRQLGYESFGVVTIWWWKLDLPVIFKALKHPLDCIVVVVNGRFQFQILMILIPNTGQTVYLCLLAKSLKCISEELPKSPMSVCTLQTCEYFHMEIGIMPLPRVGSHSVACSSKRITVVWPSSQLFMCWGCWAKTWCQVIVLNKSIKKVKVWFSLHDMCFSLSSWNPLELCS